MSIRDSLRSVFDSDYCGAKEFITHVIKPIFGDKDVDVLDVPVINPTQADEETLEKANIQEILWVATVDRVGTDPIQVFDVTLGDSTNISRARVGIQRIIRSALFPYSHAFIIFHHRVLTGTEWRFSYVYKQDKNANITDAKRFTYLFSRELHARTAIDRFEELANSNKDNEALLTAFNVEALSDEFFEKYRAYYAELVKYITGKEYVKEGGKYAEKSTGKPDAKLYAAFGKDDKAVRDYVKKLMGRITFLHFLQRKGWMNADKNFMLHLFEKSKHKSDYMDKVLEPLFFGILNTKVKDRYSLFKESGWDVNLLDEWKSIPYLNGGLFEQEPFDCNNSVFPKDYFARLFQFFSEYNFTVDENDPDDAEVGVDPEMLGKIFENLLEDNKDKGAFYTPKEIVRYMCRESLIAYLLEKTGIDATVIRDFVTSPYEKEEQMKWADKETILTALENVKICDPAIGSGAFPMGLLNELVRCEEAIVLGQEKNKGRADLKKAIIKNNIYGVDIEKGAIDIARLRFWLSLVVDEEEASPLPNLDYKIMQGNSLLESYKGMDLSHLLDGQDGLLNFGDDTRRSLKEKLDQYYICEDHAQKKQLQSIINDLVHQQIVDSGRVVQGFESVDVSANQEFFLWHTWFSDVFNRNECSGRKPGFDIVIGNPPYVVISRDNPYHEYSTVRCLELYALFFEQSIRLLRQNGILSFITGSLYTKGLKFSTLRNFLETNTELLHFRNEGDAVFDAVNMPTSTILLRKKPSNWSIDIQINGQNPLVSKIETGIQLKDISEIQRGFEVGRDKVTEHGSIPFLTGTCVTQYYYKRKMFISNEVKKAYAKEEKYYRGERLLLRETGACLTAVYLNESIYCNRSLYTALIKDKRFNTKFVVACLNSKVLQYYYQIKFKADTDLFPKIRIAQAKLLPLPLQPSTVQQAIAQLVDAYINCDRGDELRQNKIIGLINESVYNAYGLSKEDIGIIERGVSNEG